MNKCEWAVVAECIAKNNGVEENFNRVVALFLYPATAHDFIEKCLPAETQDRFSVKHLADL